MDRWRRRVSDSSSGGGSHASSSCCSSASHVSAARGASRVAGWPVCAMPGGDRRRDAPAASTPTAEGGTREQRSRAAHSTQRRGPEPSPGEGVAKERQNPCRPRPPTCQVRQALALGEQHALRHQPPPHRQAPQAAQLAQLQGQRVADAAELHAEDAGRQPADGGEGTLAAVGLGCAGQAPV